MSNLLETLAAELERPRELSARVVNYIEGTYSVDKDAIGVFLVEELPKLEDYELDLILSPVFTPKLADQTIFADLLGTDSIPREEWPTLVQSLVARPTRAQLVTPDGRGHLVGLREVTVERYVYRLRLDATISESIFSLISRIPSAADRTVLKAVARSAVWEDGGTRTILESYLASVIDHGSYSLSDTLQLLSLVENRKPADTADLLAKIPHWQEALRHQIEVASGPKPFFSERVQDMHGGGRDQRGPDDVRVSAKENELEFIGRLQQVLAAR